MSVAAVSGGMSSVWPPPRVQRRVVATAFLATALCQVAALTLLVLVAPSSATVGSPVWHATWLLLLSSRVAFAFGLALFARQPHRGRRAPLASGAAGFAVLALAIGLAGYAVAVYGPRLSLLPGSEAVIAAGEQGVVTAILTAVDGGLTLAGQFALGSAVVCLSLACATDVLEDLEALLGFTLGVSLVAVTIGGLTILGDVSAVTSTLLTLAAALWVGGVGVRLSGTS